MTDPALLPSRFRLPQHCSPDRRRAREATLRQQRERYALVTDPPVNHGQESYALPPRIARMPAAEEFTPVKRAWMLQHKFVAAANALSAFALNPTGRVDSARDYARMLIAVPPPDVMRNWRDDAEFARQRLNGANPRELRAWRPGATPGPAGADPVDDRALVDAAAVVLRHDGGGHTVADLARDGRLFAADYGYMTHPLVQQHVVPGLQLNAPLALFYADDARALRCLAIRMAPGRSVVTPLATDARWLHARSHVQAADGLIHEGVRHLMETHLVTEVFVVVTARQLHPDHPVSQLLSPHLRFTVALDSLARVDLLSIGGPIDLGVAAGVVGALNLARIHWKTWNFTTADPEVDFKERGLGGGAIADHHYVDDSRALWALIRTYVREVLAVWYRSPADVAGDTELQAWAAELAGAGGVQGFPTAFARVEDLELALSRVVFRTTAGHAAVNNGQFEKYTWVPNSPGSMQAIDLRDDEPMTEDLLWQSFPPLRRSLAQLSMAWILSTPTDRSIIAAGDVPAFDPALSPPAARAVGAFRRELKVLSARIGARNERLVAEGKVPYTWLDPYNVSCSIDT